MPACLHPCTHLAPCLLCRSAGCAPAALQAQPSQAPARAMPSCTLCKRTLGLLCALLRTAEIPLNELFSKNFGRCARQVVEDGACGAGLHHPRPPPRARMLHSCCADLIHVLLTEISNQSVYFKIFGRCARPWPPHRLELLALVHLRPACPCPTPPAALLAASPLVWPLHYMCCAAGASHA